MLDAFEKTTGLPKKVDNRNPDTIRLVAYHEVYYLIAKLFSDIQEITISANYMSRGYNLFTPNDGMLDFQQSCYH